MAKLEASYFDLSTLDALARRDTAIHRLDPRAKVLATALFTVAVVSFDKYEVAALLPMVLYPVVVGALAGLPAATLLRKMLPALPFALFIGIFNPLLDREILLQIGGIGISGGWVSFTSILVRFSLTVSAALILIASTGFHAVCLALEKLGTPKGFVVQLLFLYRYLFVLIDEAGRMSRARALRSFHGKGTGIGPFTSMIGQLLLRTLDRAQRIHLAMLSRGFDGEIRTSRRLRATPRDVAFLLGWSAFFALARFSNLPSWLGRLVTEFPK